MFVLIGIDQDGRTKLFADTDKSDETITINMDITGYAFLLAYSDTTTNPVANYESGVYVVKRGDTLSKIASMLGKSVAYLVEKNQLKDPNCLWANQLILY